VIHFRKPTDDAVRAFLDAQRDAPFSYPEVGATAAGPPSGYAVDHTRTRLGAGDDVYAAAIAALRRWAMFDLGWVELRWPDARIAVGTTVAVLAHFGAWWLNAARIVTVFDDPAPRRRFGFAYGTLEDHVEQGEERFGVEWDDRDGSVWYDLLAFSRPRHPLVRTAYPVARRLQRRFARDSARAMAAAVAARR
jgi:uncharacterized protein (UPF0548 family)